MLFFAICGSAFLSVISKAKQVSFSISCTAVLLETDSFLFYLSEYCLYFVRTFEGHFSMLSYHMTFFSS